MLHRRLMIGAAVGALLALFFVVLAVIKRRGNNPDDGPPAPPPFIPTTHIVAAGSTFDIGTPVVLWTDRIGYNAYATRRWFSAGELPGEEGKPPAKDASPLRYSRRSTSGLSSDIKKSVEKDGWTLKSLNSRLSYFVLHFDAVGSSLRCFRALHDVRGLSVHFMLDLDGTIYQTLDCQERAFHAADANDVSIGVEIASIGAHSTPLLLEAWYGVDDDGLIRNLFPAAYKLGTQRRTDYTPRPARQELLSGEIHGRKLVQYDYTPAQYDALARLAAGLSILFPRLDLKAPVDSKGRVVTTILTPAQRTSFNGILGHFHLTKQKTDPGPAFNWPVFLAASRELRQTLLPR